jgi:tRNA(Ile)-lysidine synthase
LRAAERAEPLADGELPALFAPMAAARRIALAVSGGADSLALLDAVERWRRLTGGPEAVVLTVDHRLREGSDREAERVVAIAVARGLQARRLAWEDPHPAGDIEAAARKARYRLLIGATRELLASHLLLAHHRDDQAETFLMRLQRGSGVFGLAAMRAEVRAGDVTLFRPFLGLPRSRLAATAAAAGFVPVEDPMNSDPRFLRARIRRIMPLLAAEGFGPAEIAATTERLARAADAIDRAVDRLIAEAVTVDPFAVAAVDGAAFVAAPEEVRHRFLVRLLAAIGGDDYPPRFARLRGLHQAMVARAGPGRFKRTLAGVVIEWRHGRFLAYREAGRDGLPTTALAGGYAGTWDHRFRVAVGRHHLDGLTLGPLGEAGRIALGLSLDGTPAAAVAALPALRRRGKVVAVPAVGHASLAASALDLTVTPIVAERLAEPRRFPDLTGQEC